MYKRKTRDVFRIQYCGSGGMTWKNLPAEFDSKESRDNKFDELEATRNKPVIIEPFAWMTHYRKSTQRELISTN